ncbi:hypothetical protein CPB86DRAFT_854736 [Serendipita vermifera]|nr:hypothetical protein CPB86DRAFT_854736 [Serendipita vermifera]
MPRSGCKRESDSCRCHRPLGRPLQLARFFLPGFSCRPAAACHSLVAVRLQPHPFLRAEDRPSETNNLILERSAPATYRRITPQYDISPVLTQGLLERIDRLRMRLTQKHVHDLIKNTHRSFIREGPPRRASSDLFLKRYIKEHAVQLLGLARGTSSEQADLSDSEAVAKSPCESWIFHNQSGAKLQMDWKETKSAREVLSLNLMEPYNLGSTLKRIGQLPRDQSPSWWRDSVLGGMQDVSSRKQLLLRHQFPTAATSILEELGVEGMSSEESEGEIGSKNRRYFVKVLPWRSEALTTWLHQIDRLPAPRRGKGTRQYTRRTRILNRPLPVSKNRTIPTGLPRAFYREEWIASASKSALARLEVSEENIPIPRIKQFFNDV